MSARRLLKTVTLNDDGGNAKTYNILAAANGLVPTGRIGSNSELELIINNTGAGNAYIGTQADIDGDGGNTVTTNIIISAGVVGLNVGPFEVSGGDLKLRLLPNAQLVVTPLFTPR